MKKVSDPVLALIEELNELELFSMAASLEELYHSPDFGNFA